MGANITTNSLDLTQIFEFATFAATEKNKNPLNLTEILISGVLPSRYEVSLPLWYLERWMMPHGGS